MFTNSQTDERVAAVLFPPSPSFPWWQFYIKFPSVTLNPFQLSSNMVSLKDQQLSSFCTFSLSLLLPITILSFTTASLMTALCLSKSQSAFTGTGCCIWFDLDLAVCLHWLTDVVVVGGGGGGEKRLGQRGGREGLCVCMWMQGSRGLEWDM